MVTPAQIIPNAKMQAGLRPLLLDVPFRNWMVFINADGHTNDEDGRLSALANTGKFDGTLFRRPANATASLFKVIKLGEDSDGNDIQAFDGRDAAATVNPGYVLDVAAVNGIESLSMGAVSRRPVAETHSPVVSLNTHTPVDYMMTLRNTGSSLVSSISRVVPIGSAASIPTAGGVWSAASVHADFTTNENILKRLEMGTSSTATINGTSGAPPADFAAATHSFRIGGCGTSQTAGARPFVGVVRLVAIGINLEPDAIEEFDARLLAEWNKVNGFLA